MTAVGLVMALSPIENNASQHWVSSLWRDARGSPSSVAPVVRVLQVHQPRPDRVLVVRMQEALEPVHIEDTGSPVDHPQGDAAERRRGSDLPQEDVAGALDQHLVLRPAVDP